MTSPINNMHTAAPSQTTALCGHPLVLPSSAHPLARRTKWERPMRRRTWHMLSAIAFEAVAWWWCAECSCHVARYYDYMIAYLFKSMLLVQLTSGSYVPACWVCESSNAPRFHPSGALWALLYFDPKPPKKWWGALMHKVDGPWNCIYIPRGVSCPESYEVAAKMLVSVRCVHWYRLIVDSVRPA